MTCIFCGDSLDLLDTVTVRRGIANIIELSNSKCDGIGEALKNVSEITVHIECRRKYTRHVDRERSRSPTTAPSKTGRPATVPRLRSTSKAVFNFQTDCLFCGELAVADNSKHAVHRRRKVHLARTLSIRDTILKRARDRHDEWGNDVLQRICHVIDLVASDGRYHHDCYVQFTKEKAKCEPGRPENSVSADIFHKLCEYIDEHDDCQFTIHELRSIMASFADANEFVHSERHLKRKLLEVYGPRITITEIPGKVNVLMLKDTAHKILSDKWYTDRDLDEQKERERIVKAAAAIIREDIRQMYLDCSKYPNADEINADDSHLIPNSLRIFTDNVLISKSISNSSNVIRRRKTINHAVMFACRPRSFISPLQIGLSVFLHRTYGSSLLIDILSGMGFCSSYSETMKYQDSAMVNSIPKVSENGFVQFVFDNADVNTRTLDGMGTFHALGGIRCVTPSAAISVGTDIPRITKETKTKSKNEIRIHHYRKPKVSGLSTIFVEDLNVHAATEYAIKKSQAFKFDMLWIHNIIPKADTGSSGVGWNGYMQIAVDDGTICSTSRVMAVPFINLEPGNLTTLFSALRFAAEECTAKKQCCIVTFDQPLYLKAVEITASADKNDILSSVIFRLGGFHLLMSYLGTIGYIMEGSGIEEMWQTVYAKNSIYQMMSGHAYERSIRAHLLAHQSLVILITSNFCDFRTDFLEGLHNLSENALLSKIAGKEACSSHDLTFLTYQNYQTTN